jgi:hypothetical protein
MASPTTRAERLGWRPEQAIAALRAGGSGRAIAALAMCEQLSAAGDALADVEMAIVFFSRALDGLQPGPVPAERMARLEHDLGLETSPVLTAWLASLRAPVRVAQDLDAAIQFLLQARGIWLSMRRIRDQAAEPDEFPVGAALADGSVIVEAIRGDDVRGMYRAVDPRGRRLLVTVTSRQKQPHAQVERELRLPAVDGIAPLRSLGPIDDEHDAMAEEEPAGRPSSELALPLWPGDAVELSAQVAAVLERVHAAGAVLRFLRPELVYLEQADGRPRLTGIAPRADLFVIGASPVYGAKPLFEDLFAAPEVLAMRKGVTAAADVFSLCAALAVWLTGEHPFEGETGTAQLGAIVNGRGRVWRGPTALGMVLGRGLEKSPDARPTLPALVRELRAAASER